MTLTQKFLGATAALALSAGAVAADPAIIFDLGGKFDKSFNESAFLPCRYGRSHGIRNQHSWLHRRHGHPADP